MNITHTEQSRATAACVNALVFSTWKKPSPRKTKEGKSSQRHHWCGRSCSRCVNVPVALWAAAAPCWRLQPTGGQTGCSQEHHLQPNRQQKPAALIYFSFLSFCALGIVLFEVFAFSCADGLSVSSHSENSFYFFLSFQILWLRQPHNPLKTYTILETRLLPYIQSI